MSFSDYFYKKEIEESKVGSNVSSNFSEIKERSVKALEESLKDLEKSKEAGADTLVTMAEQGERIDNIGFGIDRISGQLQVANRMISRIQNAITALVFKPFQRKVRLFNNSPQRPQFRIEFTPSGEESGVDIIQAGSSGTTVNIADTARDIASRAIPMVWGKAAEQLEERKRAEERAREELLEIEVEEESRTGNEMTKNYQDLIDSVINKASTEVGVLKNMSLTMNSELDRQNSKLEKVGSSADKTNSKLRQTNRRIQKELV